MSSDNNNAGKLDKDKIAEQNQTHSGFFKKSEKEDQERTLPEHPTQPFIVQEDKTKQNVDQFKTAVLQLLHNINSPLAVVSAQVSLLKAEYQPKEIREGLEDATYALEKVKTIISQTVAICLSEKKKLTISKKPEEIINLINEIIDRNSDPGKFVFLNTELDTAIVNIDYEHMRQVIENIIDNAMKYGKKIAEISVRIDDAYLILEIKDRGKGFAENPEELFQMFARGGNHDLPGSGIGLAYCRAVIDAHQGSIEAENYYRESTGKIKGAKFTIKLPLN